MLVLGVITPVEVLIIKPAVELNPVPLNGPPLTTFIVGLADATLAQNGLAA